MEPKPYNLYIQSLAEKWLNGTITPQEEQEFAQWYNRFNDEEELLLDKSFAAGEAELKERIYAALEKKLNGDSGIERGGATVHRVHFIRRNWFRYAAAVVLGGLLTATAYLVFNSNNNNATVAINHAANDVQPGGNKAILTLGDGAAIVLDSAANGKLAQQGSGQITKLSNGRIAYSPVAANAKEVLYNTLTVPRGGQYQLGLPDGTQVWLNSASSIRYPTAFIGKQRNVEVTGEVYFEVAKNVKMPFKVKLNNAAVEVLGTHFNINAYAEEALIKTTLLEGSIKMEQTSTHQSQLIKPGQQAQLSATEIKLVSNVDTEQVMAWKTGFFEFDNTELPVIMRQVGRWYDVDVLFESKPSQEKFGGRISKNLLLSKVLGLLETNGVKFRLEGRKLVVF